MPVSRILLSIALILALAGAPALRAMAMPAPQAADTHAHHAMHAASDEASDASTALGMADQSASSCAQHDFCNGQCCASCAQCFTAVSLRLPGGATQHAVLMPVTRQLLFNSFVSLRERPPRLLSV